MSDKTPRTEREFHDIHIRHEVAHLLAFREAKCFSEKLESELAAANERAEAYKTVAEALLPYIEHLIPCQAWTYPDAKPNLCTCGMTAAKAKLEALNQLKKEIK
jgi:hypothetical protein